MRVLAIDFGDARTGFAVSDLTGLLATSLETLHETDPVKVAEFTARRCRELGADRVILGMPKNMNNTLGPRAEKTLAFRDILAGKLNGLPVILWDERGTTLSAARILNERNVRGKKRKGVIDTVAAAVLLQSYLDSRPG